MIAFHKGTTDWRRYDIAADTWVAITQSSGDGASPQAGAPNLTTYLSVIGVPIPEYGVIMFIQSAGQSDPGSAWLYRHS